jgi:ATP-binding cassette subfamily B protein
MFAFLKSISAKNPNGRRGPEQPAVRERVSALRQLRALGRRL